MPTFTIQFTESELLLLGRLLAEHPYKQVEPLLRNINEQVQAQLAQRAPGVPHE